MASNSRRRDGGREFQADGPTRAKHLEWAVAERMRGTTIRPRVEDRKEALAGKEETKVKRTSGRMGHPNKAVTQEGKDFELYPLLDREPVKGIPNIA